VFAFQLTVFVAIACYVGFLTANGHSLFGAVLAAIMVAIGARFGTVAPLFRPIASPAG
jgi:hypothetical protein